MVVDTPVPKRLEGIGLVHQEIANWTVAGGAEVLDNARLADCSVCRGKPGETQYMHDASSC